MKKKKHFVTLIEVLIAIGLVSVLLTVLLGVYHQIDVMHNAVDKGRLENFRLRYVQTRLAAVLSNTLPKKDRDFYFFLTDDNQDRVRGASLVFSYNNGVDVQPVFSNTVIGRLFVDQQGNLCLITWPPLGRLKGAVNPAKKEILLDHVSDLQFEFYVPPEMEDQRVIKDTKISSDEKQKIPNAGEWNLEWPIHYKQLPAIVRVHIKRTVKHGLAKPGEVITFAIPLPNADQTILYKK